jgi:hypothetical protein
VDVSDWCHNFADKDCIIGGDLNAKNNLWGYQRNDEIGDILIEICNIYD